MEDNSADYFTWRDADRRRSVRISREVMKQLHVDVMRGYGRTRRRGTECGGVLLGTTSPDGEITVDGFSGVSCEYAFGPSFQLSPNDETLFRDAVERAGSSAIGFFRSNTREDLAIDEADAQLFSKMLNGKGQVALLLRPFATKPPAASFYFPDPSGALSAAERAKEFVFSPRLDEVVEVRDDVSESTGAVMGAEPLLARAATVQSVAAAIPVATSRSTVPAVDRSPAPTPAPLRPAPVTLHVSEQRQASGAPSAASSVLALCGPAASTDPKAPSADSSADLQRVLPSFAAVPQADASTRGWLTALLGILCVASALLTGVVSGFQIAGGRIRFLPEFRIERPQLSSAYVVGLRVSPAGNRIRLSWPFDSFAVRTATSGTLTITDGMEPKTIVLLQSEVRDGLILHAPESDHVRFRMELTLPDQRSIAESVEWTKQGGPSRP